MESKKRNDGGVEQTGLGDEADQFQSCWESTKARRWLAELAGMKKEGIWMWWPPYYCATWRSAALFPERRGQLLGRGLPGALNSICFMLPSLYFSSFEWLLGAESVLGDVTFRMISNLRDFSPEQIEFLEEEEHAPVHVQSILGGTTNLCWLANCDMLTFLLISSPVHQRWWPFWLPVKHLSLKFWTDIRTWHMLGLLGRNVASPRCKLVHGILMLFLSSSEWAFNAIQSLSHRTSYCLTKPLSNSTMRLHVNTVYWEDVLDPHFVLFAISITFPTASNNFTCSFSWDKQAMHPSILRCLLHRCCLRWVLLGDFQALFFHSFLLFHSWSKRFEFYSMQWGNAQRWQRW